MTASDRSVGTLVIGAGPGGYVAAIRAAQLGEDVALVDEEAWGGTCLNHGCIPSKALISASNVAHDAANAEEMGIDAEVSADLGRMVDWKDETVVSRLTTGVERLCRANGVDLIEGRAEFVDEHAARIDGGDETVEFEHAILATGSRPLEIPNFSFGDDPVLSSREALALREAPDSLVIVGAGYIGMELAMVFAKLGTDVTVVEMLDSAIPICDDDLTEPVTKRARDLGIDFHFGQAASEWREAGEGITVVTEDEDGETTEFDTETVLVAVGRQPVTETLNLEAAGIEPGEGGFIDVDEQCRTALDHVFAVGDVAGEPLLAHKASAQGLVAAEVIGRGDATFDPQAIPAAIFTDPEIGMVGLSPEDAEEADREVLVGEFPFYSSGRALTTGHVDGFVRVLADADSEILLGAQVVGPEASELIGELGLAVENGLTLEDVGGTIHTHPTLSEAVMEAAENALGRAIHTLNR